jgi:tetratricopeptide (TPR) repeat protein
MELDTRDEPRELDEATWQGRRRRLEASLPASGADPRLMDAARDPHSWLRAEAKEIEEAQRWADLIPLLDRLIAAEPAWRNYDRRGYALAALGRYSEAVRDMAQARERGGEEWAADWRRGGDFAVLLLATGDIEGARDRLGELLGRFGGTVGYPDITDLAFCCSICPRPVEGLDRLMQRLNELAKHAHNDYRFSYDGSSVHASQYHRARACIAYRTGQLDVVIEHFQQDRIIGEAESCFLAMAHARLGHTAEARKWLDRQRTEFDKRDRSGTPDVVPPMGMQLGAYRLGLRLLCREAEAVVTGRP